MLKFPVQSLRNSIFVRQIFIYLIVILPIILMGVYLYNWSYNNASQDLSRASLAQISNYLEGFDREIEWMEIQQFDILEDNDLKKLAVTWELMDGVERRAGLNYLLHRLTSFKNSSAYIKNIYVHIPSINKTVSAVNAVDELDWKRFDDFRSNSDSRENRLISWDHTLYLSASKPYGEKGEKPLLLVQIELDANKLKDSLNQVNTYPESGSFLILDASGFALGNGADSGRIIPSYSREAKGIRSSTLILDSNGKEYHIDKAHSSPLGLTVATYLPEGVLKSPLSRFYKWAWLFAFTSMITIVIYSYSTYKAIHKPLLLLVQSFKRMEGGALDMRIEHEKKDEFGYLYNRFNHMIKKLQSLIDQDFKQKMMMQKAELKQLQSQINPHFLYNSFFILNSLAKIGDLERIELFTNMLGEYFRFITRNGEDEVCLSEEIKHSRMYTEIQQLRFSRRVKAQFDELPKGMERIRVPKLIIQPIIENAYEHSLEKMTDEGFLRVSFGIDQDEARIIIEDNGDPLSDPDIERLRNQLIDPSESEMTGMINIHRRIVLTYGEGSGLFLSRSELNGLKTEIRINLKEASGDV